MLFKSIFCFRRIRTWCGRRGETSERRHHRLAVPLRKVGRRSQVSWLLSIFRLNIKYVDFGQSIGRRGRLKWPFLRRKSFPETTIPGTRKIGRSKFSAPPLFTEIIGFGIGFGIFINFGKKSCRNVGSSQANHVKLTIFYCFLFHFLI